MESLKTSDAHGKNVILGIDEEDCEGENDIKEGKSATGNEDEAAIKMSSTSTKSRSYCKRFGCTYSGCKRTYTTVGNLKTHLKSHSGEYTFRCTFEGCSRTFQSSYNLKIHVRVHTGEKPYYCKEKGCEKVFSSLYRMKVHQRVHSGNTFDCEFKSCEKVFTTMKDLRRHHRTHTGERPFQCKVEGCGSSFTVAHHLKDHMRSHKGVRPFSCNETGCVKAFGKSSHLKTHMKTHNRDKSQNGETNLASDLSECSVLKTISEKEVGSKTDSAIKEKAGSDVPSHQSEKAGSDVPSHQSGNEQQQNNSVCNNNNKTSMCPLETDQTSLSSNQESLATVPFSESDESEEQANDEIVTSVGICNTAEPHEELDEADSQNHTEQVPVFPNILGICSLSTINPNSRSNSWQLVDPKDGNIDRNSSSLNPNPFPHSMLPFLFPDFNYSNIGSQSGISLPTTHSALNGNITLPRCVFSSQNTSDKFTRIFPSPHFFPALPRPVFPGYYPFIPFPGLLNSPLSPQLPTSSPQPPESSIVVRDNTLVIVSGTEEFPLTSADNSVISLE